LDSFKQHSYITPFIIAIVALAAAAACSDESSTPTPTELATVSRSEEQPAQRSPTPYSSQRPETVDTAIENSSECQVGQVLEPGDRCTYPATSDEFWVDDTGVGHFLFFTANSEINAQNATINNQAYDFAARRQEDGTWKIELSGTPSESVRVSDLIALVGDAPTATRVPVQQQVALVPSPAPTPQGPATSPTPSHVPAPDEIQEASLPESTPVTEPTQSRSSNTETIIPQVTPTSMASAPTVSAIPSPTHVAESTPQLVLTDEQTLAMGGGEVSVAVGESITLDASQAFDNLQGDSTVRYSAIFSNSAVARGEIDGYTGELNIRAFKEGSSWVALRICQRLICSRLGDVTVHVKVVPPPNRPPQAVRDIEDMEVRVGEEITSSVASYFWDIEGDNITNYRVLFGEEYLATAQVDAPSGNIRFYGSRVGSTSVSVVACDSNGCSGGQSALRFTLDVLPPPNQPPIATGNISDQRLHVGDTLKLDVSSLFRDPEGDPIREYGFFLTNRSIATGMIESETGQLIFKGARKGTTTVAVDASDGPLASIRPDLTFKLTVTEPSRNPPSVVGTVPDQTVNLGRSVELSVANAFEAPDPYRIIRYDVFLKDSEVSTDRKITRGGVLTLKGTEEGKSWVSVRACSYVGCSNFSELSFVLIVTDPDEELNSSPEAIGALQDRIMVVGESITLDVSGAFSDPDDDRIVDYRYRLSRPRTAVGSSITDTGILRLRAARVGTTTVSVSACDDEDECSDPDDMYFTLTVESALSRLHTGTEGHRASNRPYTTE